LAVHKSAVRTAVISKQDLVAIDHEGAVALRNASAFQTNAISGMAADAVLPFREL
jgi:hypothetical protein